MKDHSAPTFPFGPLTLDAAAYGSQGSAILGIRDSGKTYTATLMAEHLFEAGVPFVAFDPIGVWRFLRVPGAGRGYPVVVAGGQDGDLALTPETAPRIVEAAMEKGVSLVLNLFSMEMSKADWRKIVRASVELLLHRNAAHGLRHVFIEEAAEFIPQKVYDGETYAAVEKLARMGGNVGLGYTLINQRAEEVNKAVLELCDNLFLHRQKGRNSLTALAKWLDVSNVDNPRAIVDTLATLPTGECWAWLAGSERPVLVKVPEKNSLHPDRRAMRGNVGASRPAVDAAEFVEALRAALATTGEDASQARKGANRVKAAPDPAAIEEAERRGYEKAVADGQFWARVKLEPLAADLRRLADQVDGLRADFLRWTSAGQRASGEAALPEPMHNSMHNPGPVSEKPTRTPARRPSAPSGTGALPGSARKMLDTLSRAGGHLPSWDAVAVLSVLSPSGGNFNAAKKALLDGGHVRVEPGASLVAVAPKPGNPLDLTSIQMAWERKLGGSAKRIIAHLSDGRPATWANIAAALGLSDTGGNWNAAKAALRRNNLVHEDGGRVRLNPLLIDGGARG